MKLIHCADLHLDSPMETNLTAEQARLRTNELRMSFERLIQYAKDQKVAAVLICGDLFDSRRVTALTAGIVLEEIRKASEVAFFYLRGNHDETCSVFCDCELPENLHLFDDRWQSYTLGDLEITGVELTEENGYDPYDGLQLQPEKTNIVMLHGDAAGAAGRDSIPLARLRGKGIDYLALGHIHAHSMGRLDERGVWCFSGCLEGRGFDECGEKGFVLLELQPSGRLHTEFVPFAARQLYSIPVDVTGAQSHTEITGRALAATAELPSESLVKIVLTGSREPELHMDPAMLAQQLSSGFFFAKVVDESRLACRPEDYRYDVSLRGAFVRLLLDSGETPEDCELILRTGLEALAGEEITL